MGAFFAFALLGSVLPLAVVVLVIVAVLSGRYEPDPDRERPRAVYLSAACFVGVFALLGAAFLVTTSLLGLTTDSGPTYDSFSSGPFSSSAPAEIGQARPQPFDDGIDDDAVLYESSLNSSEDNNDISSAVGGGIVALLALALLFFHDPKLTRLVRDSRGPGARVYSKYLYVLCFVAMLVLLGAATLALYSIFSAVAPGIASVGSRSEALRQLATSGVLALGAALIFVLHWRRADALVVGVPVVETIPPVEPSTPQRGRIVRGSVRPEE